MPKRPPPGPAPAPSLWPPRRLLVSLASLAAATLLVRAGFLEYVAGGIIDGAVRNIITLILGFTGLVSALAWFLRESGHARPLKRGVLFGVAALVGAGMAALRIEGVSGDLVPRFRARWQKPRDALLEPAVAAGAAASASPWTASADDFARFLGPAGTGVLAGPDLDGDWKARPPRELWRRPIGAGWSGFATSGEHAVTLEQRGDEEIVTCLDLATGAPQWQVAVRARHETVLGGIGPRSTPAIADGVVFAAGATGWLHAIDGATGRVLWKKDVPADLGIDAAAHAEAIAWGRAGSPLVLDDVVVVPGGGPRDDGPVTLVAYDRSSGERRWTAGDDQISYCSPTLLTLGGREQLVVVGESRVMGFDPASREELWRFPWPGHSNSDASCTQPVVIGPARVFVSKGYGIGAAAFDVVTGDDGTATTEEAWRNPAGLKTKFTNVVTHRGHVYGLSDGILECLRAADGKRVWKGGRYDQGQLLLVGDLLVVQSEPGDVVLVEATPERHREVARLAALDGQTWNNPTLAGDRLLVRNATEAACYRLPVHGRSAEPKPAAAAPETPDPPAADPPVADPPAADPPAADPPAAEPPADAAPAGAAEPAA